MAKAHEAPIPGLSTFTGPSGRTHTGYRVWVSLWSPSDIPRPHDIPRLFFLFLLLPVPGRHKRSELVSCRPSKGWGASSRAPALSPDLYACCPDLSLDGAVRPWPFTSKYKEKD